MDGKTHVFPTSSGMTSELCLRCDDGVLSEREMAQLNCFYALRMTSLKVRVQEAQHLLLERRVLGGMVVYLLCFQRQVY